jgi:hypothetical protein
VTTGLLMQGGLPIAAGIICCGSKLSSLKPTRPSYTLRVAMRETPLYPPTSQPRARRSLLPQPGQVWERRHTEAAANPNARAASSRPGQAGGGMRPRKSGSQLTRRWRGMDSNFRFRAR